MANNNINLKVGVDYTELTGLIKTTDQTKRALNLVSKEFANTGDQKSWMRGVNQIIQAQKKLDASARMSRSEIMSLAHQMKQATQFSNALANSTTEVGKRMSRGGVLMQQTGYQVGDFIVQIQSGTNAFVAFGQQATQIAGTLTLMGGRMVAIGSALGVAIPLVTAFAAAWMRTRKDVDDSAKALKTLGQNLESLDKKLEDWVRTKKAAAAGVTIDELISSEGLEQAEQNLKNLRDALSEVLSTKSLSSAAIDALPFLSQVYGTEAQAEQLINAVAEAEQRVADIRAKIRQEAREDAEAELLAAEEERIRTQALAEYRAGQEVLAQRKAWVSEAIGIFRDAQERMRNEEIAQTEASLERLFRNRTVSYRIRFAGDASVMGQAVAPSGGLMNPGMTRQELLDSGVSEANLSNFRIKPDPIKPRGGGGGGSKVDPVEQLRKQLELEESLLGVSEDRARVINALGLEFVQKNPEIAEGLQEQIAKTRELIEAEKERQSVLQNVETSLENGLMAMVEGTKSVKDAFKDMARAIIKELYDVYVVQRLVGGFGQNGGSGSGLLGLLGGLFGKASGGTVMSNQPYLVGEKGPELIVPRNRGHVMNADLTADALGGGGGVTVVQNFHFQANGDESVKKLIAQAAPSIANMAKQSVMDSRRRGGAMKNAFG